MNQTKRILLISSLAGLLVTGFQNCGKAAKFSESSIASTSDGDQIIPPAPASNQSSSAAPSQTTPPPPQVSAGNVCVLKFLQYPLNEGFGVTKEISEAGCREHVANNFSLNPGKRMAGYYFALSRVPADQRDANALVAYAVNYVTPFATQ